MAEKITCWNRISKSRVLAKQEAAAWDWDGRYLNVLVCRNCWDRIEAATAPCAPETDGHHKANLNVDFTFREQMHGYPCLGPPDEEEYWDVHGGNLE